MKLANPVDKVVDEILEEYVPLTLVSSIYRGKIQINILKETREVIEVFLHDVHDRYGPSTIHDRLRIEEPLRMLGLSKTTLNEPSGWLKEADYTVIIETLREASEEHLNTITMFLNINEPTYLVEMMRQTAIHLSLIHI